MPARRFVMLVKESSYGVPMDTPVLGTDAFYLRLGDGTDIQDNPIIQETPHGGGFTTAACAWSDQRTHEGTLATLLYPSQAKILLDWALTNINVGRTTPWVTTDAGQKSPPGDLASMSIYDAIQNLDGSFTRTAHRGCKVDSGTLNLVMDGAGRAAALSLQIKGGDIETVDDTEFPAPGATDYPCGPYVASDLGGSLIIGTSRALYDNFAFSANNGLATRYWGGAKTPYVQNSFGRVTTLGVWLPRKSTPDDFGDYSGVIDAAVSFELNTGVSGSKWVKVDLGPRNHWSAFAKKLPDGEMYGWDGMLKNRFNAATGYDLIVTGGTVA